LGKLNVSAPENVDRSTTPVGADGSAPADANGVADLALGKRVFNIRTMASFVVALAILAFMVSRVNVDIASTREAISRANPLYLLAAFVAYYLIFPLRGLRWRRMLANAGTGRRDLPSLAALAEIIFVSFFVNCLVPAKLGDVYRAYLLKLRSKISGTRAAGTVVAERLLDISTLLLLGGLAGLLSLRGQPGDRLTPYMGPLEALAAAVVVASLVLLAMRQWSGRVRLLIPSKARGMYDRFVEGAVGAFGGFHVLVPLTLAAWAAEAARLFLVLRAIGLRLSPDLSTELALVTVVALLGSLLTALPLTPAGLGFVETGLVAALLIVGVQDQSLALTVAVLDRSISYASLVVIGFVVYLVRERAGLSATVTATGEKAEAPRT
jgi:glycosyltransferase 2 family protein